MRRPGYRNTHLRRFVTKLELGAALVLAQCELVQQPRQHVIHEILQQHIRDHDRLQLRRQLGHAIVLPIHIVRLAVCVVARRVGVLGGESETEKTYIFFKEVLMKFIYMEKHTYMSKCSFQ